MIECAAMKFGSLFTGIGGFDSGFENAGLECAWQVEIEPSCITVLERHFPNVTRYTDVKAVSATNLEPVDVLVGGFPCQDLSVAGKRAGLAGERSGLWYEFYRIIAGTLPRWCVIENVPGLLSSNGGRDFGVIVRGLLDLGYCGAWRVLDAQYFGLAQRRKRVFIVGSLGDGSCAEILFNTESVFGDSPPRREARARVAACLDGSPYADREAEESRLIASSITTGTGKSSGPRNGNGHPLNLINVPDLAWALQERDAKGADSDTKDRHLIVASPYRTSGNCGPFEQGDRTGALNTGTDQCQTVVVTHALSSEGNNIVDESR